MIIDCGNPHCLCRIHKRMFMEDEVIVKVASALGGYMGEFFWPRDDIQIIKDLGAKSKCTNVYVIEPKYEMCINERHHRQRGEIECNGSCQSSVQEESYD